ncbi:MAG: type III-B CRISPR module RAMP protein Cmr4 [Exilibacterium sp.]
MFTAQKALFLYAVSPVHMGAGTALGLIDNPIQRERHTDYPVIAGSGLKGAVRHRFWQQAPGQREKLDRYFGRDTNNLNDKASDYAGAVSFSDAQLIAFPVRCGRAGFVYATSPLALARGKRLLAAAGVSGVESWSVSTPAPGRCGLINEDLLCNGKLQVDSYELEPEIDTNLKSIAEWIAANAFPNELKVDFFKEKFQSDLVLMSDDDFGYFVKNATLVEPHVRIDNDTGVAEGGGLFYTENLPPESLLLSVVMATDERSSYSKKAEAASILNDVVEANGGFGGLDAQLLQVGGDAITGRGQIIVSAVECLR